MKLVFATNNAHKVSEIQQLVPAGIQVVSLKQAGIQVEIEEPFYTLEENASEKSRFIEALTGLNCFSEDSGLEVEALNGAPGVLSARFAGEAGNDAANIEKLLQLMEGEDNRNAQFRTVISLRLHGSEYFFEGVCPGSVGFSAIGENGFGYDPVFFPEGSDSTFAQMQPNEKNQFSHRAKATEKLLEFLKYYEYPATATYED